MGRGIDTFKERAKYNIEDRPRTGTAVARFSTFTAGSAVLIYAFLPETIGTYIKDVDITEYNSIAAFLASSLTVVVAYIREIATLIKDKLS